MEIYFFNYTSKVLEVIHCKEVCSKLNAPTAAKPPWSHSNPQRANQLTAEHVFPNAGLTGQKASASLPVLTLKMRGRDEETTGKERKRLLALALSDGRTACKKKLVKKRRPTEKTYKPKKANFGSAEQRLGDEVFYEDC